MSEYIAEPSDDHPSGLTTKERQAVLDRFQAEEDRSKAEYQHIISKHKASGQRWFLIDNTGIKKDHWIVSEVHGHFPDTELEKAEIRRVAHFETREDALLYIMLAGRLFCDDMTLESKKAIGVHR